jgi:glycosyltransferase involved in cell wall biosynthesis
MSAPANSLLLVTPVWNDSKRLAVYGLELATALAALSLPIRWVIADDGSATEDRDKLLELQQRLMQIFPQIEIHFAAKHRGKGAVVREAWSLGRDVDWLAFVDADGSVSSQDFAYLIEQAVSTGSSVLGIRKSTATTKIVESRWRGFAHRSFLVLAKTLLGLRAEDPQCGGKVILAMDYWRVSENLMEDGLAFDSEMLAELQNAGLSWLELPINWAEKAGGKVKPHKDAFAMFAALMRIRLRIRSRS